MPRGWYSDRMKHRLASKGIKTKTSPINFNANGFFKKKELSEETIEELNIEFLRAIDLVKEHSSHPKYYRDSDLFIDFRIVGSLVDYLNSNKANYGIKHTDEVKTFIDRAVKMTVIKLKNKRNIGVYFDIRKDGSVITSSASVIER